MTPKSARLKALWTNKRVRWAAVAASIALVMLVLGAFAWYPNAGDDPQFTRSELSDYDRALVSLQSGDATGTVELLEAHLRTNPDDEEAADLLARLRKQTGITSADPNGETSEDPTEPENPDVVVPDDVWEDEVADISRLLPLVVYGMESGSPVREENKDIVKPFDPKPTQHENVNRVLYAVHDLGSPEVADRYITETSRELYPKDGETVEVDGASGYFGTDGSTLATVAYTRGRYVFEIVITTYSAPEEMRFPGVEFAQAFVDSPE